MNAHEHGVRENALPPEPMAALSMRDLDSGGDLQGSAEALFAELSTSGHNAVLARKAHVKPIIAFYESRRFEPLWIGDYGLSIPAKRLLALVAKADEEGLNAKYYMPASLESFTDTADRLKSSPEAIARLDIEITVAALAYAHDALSGQVEPLRVSEMHTIKIDPVDFAAVLRTLSATVRPDRYLASLHPRIEQYTLMKQALARLLARTADDDAPEVATGSSIKPGNSDPRLPVVRKRLELAGFSPLAAPDTGVSPTAPEGIARNDDHYGPDLVAAVKSFQDKAGLSADGIIGPRTIGALNGQSTASQIEKIRLTMERLRWLPDTLAPRRVMVNQAFFETWVVDAGKTIYRSDVIVGKTKYQTAIFNDEMEYVVFNPYWTVPRSMAVDQMLPKLRSDPYYLERQGYDLLDRRGRKVSWSSVDWYGYTARNLPFEFRQPPGPKNALGGLKFMFPNEHSIYMHDTPTRSLFANATRAFSYGCVRVKTARDFATVILGAEGWTAARIDAALRSGKNRRVVLKKRVPVYLGYYTAWAEPDGTVQFRDDIYGRDRILSEAIDMNEPPENTGKLASNPLSTKQN